MIPERIIFVSRGITVLLTVRHGIADGVSNIQVYACIFSNFHGELSRLDPNMSVSSLCVMKLNKDIPAWH